MKQTLIIFCLALGLAACSGSKHVETAATDAAASATGANALAVQTVARINANATTAQAVTAKASVDIEADGKSFSLSGNLRMMRDDVIQLSLSMLGFEVARMEFTTTDVLFVDRYHKTYTRAAYTDVPFLTAVGLDFHTLQALFWAELFAPGKKATPTADAFTAAQSGSYTLLTLRDAPKLEYAFLAATKTGQLNRVNVEDKTHRTQGTFVWQYTDYGQLEGKPFPTAYAATLAGTGNAKAESMKLSVALSRLAANSDWEKRTTLSAKYTERPATDFLGALLKLI